MKLFSQDQVLCCAFVSSFHNLNTKHILLTENQSVKRGTGCLSFTVTGSVFCL